MLIDGLSRHLGGIIFELGRQPSLVRGLSNIVVDSHIKRPKLIRIRVAFRLLLDLLQKCRACRFLFLVFSAGPNSFIICLIVFEHRYVLVIHIRQVVLFVIVEVLTAESTIML